MAFFQTLAASSLSEKQAHSDRTLAALAAATLVLLIARLILAATSQLAEDEAYYWLWSQHLALGYYDHPPMIAYWIKAGTALFGDTPFGVRFLCLFGIIAASGLVYYASLALFDDRRAALLSAIWLNTTLMVNAAAIIATPDTPLAFFTALTVFALAKLTQTQDGRWWLLAGAALGLAFVSKYTATLLLPGLFLWLVALKSNRQWLFRWPLYAGALLALLIVSPVFYWNYTHEWASFLKQLSHSVKDKPANALGSMAEFLGAQAALVTPIIFAFAVYGAGLGLLRGFTARDPRWFLLGALSAPALAFFFLHSASQKIQGNWPGFLYCAAVIAAVSAGLSAAARSRSRALWVAFNTAPWVGFLFTAAAFLQLGFGILPLPSKGDPTARLKGWAEFAAKVEIEKQRSESSLVLTDRYGTTGELAFYLGSQNVVQHNERVRYADFPVPEDELSRAGTALLVARGQPDIAHVSAFFNTVTSAGSIARAPGGKPQEVYTLYRLSGYRGGLFSQRR